MLTKYGYVTIGVVSIISFVLIVISIYINSVPVKYALIIAGILLVIFTLNFFRDPERTIPAGENNIISPADGKVMLIKKVLPDIFIEEESWQISIFMSPLDVHVNRIPIDGKIDYLNYIEGKYLAAYNDKADKDNERMEIGITSKHGKILFTQVAGFVARRIITDLKLHQDVTKGERFGMIKFGSRVDVIVPAKWQPNVSSGDVVKAGESILYEIN